MTKEEKNEFDDLFKDENIPESNWFKFEKVGDKVAGEVLEIEEVPARDQYGAQRVFILKQKNGEVINVALKASSQYLMDRTKNVQPGDILGAEFKKEIPAKVKGYAPAKSIEVYVKKGVPKFEEEM